MKKLLLLLIGSIVMSAPAFADPEYSCVAPYNMNSKVRTIGAAASGFNRFVESRGESVIKKESLKVVKGDNVKINLESFSPKDLNNGIFKSFEYSGENVEVNNIYFQSVNLKTLCNFNYVVEEGKNNYIFKEDLPLTFDIAMNQYTLNQTMKNPKYQKIIEKLNKIASNYALGVQIASTKVAIKNNKFYYIMGFSVPLIKKEQKVVIQSDLKIRNGKMDFANTQVVSGKVALETKHLDFMWNYLNPLDFSVKVMDNHDVKVTTKEVNINNNTVYAKGIAVVPKS